MLVKHTQVNIVNHTFNLRKSHDYFKRCKNSLWKNLTCLIIKTLVTQNWRCRSQPHCPKWRRTQSNFIKIRMTQGCNYPHNRVLEVLATTIRQEKEITGLQTRSQLLLICRWYDIVQRSQNSTRNLLEIMNSFSKVDGPQSAHKNQ